MAGGKLTVPYDNMRTAVDAVTIDPVNREDMLGGVDRDSLEFHRAALSSDWLNDPHPGTSGAVGPSTPTNPARFTV